MIEYGPEIVDFFSGIAGGDHDAEVQFTQDLVGALRTQYPDKNALVFHNAASPLTYVNGQYYHYELPLPDGFETNGYEVWVFDSGEFTLVGDGGFNNWCFDGNFDRNGRDVTFYSIN